MLTISIILILFVTIKSDNISLKNCYYETAFDSYSILCRDDQMLNVNLSSSDLNQYKVTIKLEGKIALNLIKTRILHEIKIYLLDLSNNQNKFEAYMQTINSFEALKVLNLSRNKISIISERQFNDLIDLESLDLSHNEIFYFEVNAFDGLKNLIELNLARNELTEIENQDLDNLPRLQRVILDFNKLKRIRNRVFTALTNIASISIQFNKIERIESESFKNLINLRALYLNNNKIRDINESLFNGLVIQILNLSSNRLE